MSRRQVVVEHCGKSSFSVRHDETKYAALAAAVADAVRLRLRPWSGPCRPSAGTALAAPAPPRQRRFVCGRRRQAAPCRRLLRQRDRGAVQRP